MTETFSTEQPVGGGLLVSISGMDGSGKTTLAQGVSAALGQAGLSVLDLHMPPSRMWHWIERLGEGHEGLAEELSRGDRAGLALNLERFEFIETIVKPALATHDVVILQRYSWDWEATGRAFGADDFEKRVFQSFQNIMKALNHISFFLSIDADVANKRIQRRGELRQTRETPKLLTRMGEAYKDILARNPEIISLDAATDRQSLVDSCSLGIYERLGLWSDESGGH